MSKPPGYHDFLSELPYSKEGKDQASAFCCALDESNYIPVDDMTHSQADSNSNTLSSAIKRREGYGNSLNNALLHFTTQGDLEVVALLLDSGANINAASEEGNTALHIAACEGYLRIVELLLDKGAEINRGNSRGRTPLHRAAFKGVGDVALLLIDRGADINAAALDMATPLQHAAREGFLPLVNLFLDKGAEVNVADCPPRATALCGAACYGHAKVVELLLARGAEYRGVDHDMTPLCCAVRGEHLKVVKILLDKGADTSYCYKTVKKPQSDALQMVITEHKRRQAHDSTGKPSFMRRLSRALS